MRLITKNRWGCFDAYDETVKGWRSNEVADEFLEKIEIHNDHALVYSKGFVDITEGGMRFEATMDSVSKVQVIDNNLLTTQIDVDMVMALRQ